MRWLPATSSFPRKRESRAAASCDEPLDPRFRGGDDSRRRPIVLGPGDFLDHFDLCTVGSFEEADPTAVVRRHLLENPHTIIPKPSHRPGIVVGVERDVLDAVVLLVVLSRDQRGDVSVSPCKFT